MNTNTNLNVQEIQDLADLIYPDRPTMEGFELVRLRVKNLYHWIWKPDLPMFSITAPKVFGAFPEFHGRKLEYYIGLIFKMLVTESADFGTYSVTILKASVTFTYVK